MFKALPTLYDRSSTGKVKVWTIDVASSNSEAIITVNYGEQGGKIRKSEKAISTGKNIGKSNETTAYEQALSEAESTWKKKLDKGYSEKISSIDNEVLLPMLAHTFQKRGHDITFPAYVQPKLDGVRCLAKKVDESTIKYYSRMGKEFTTLEHLTSDLLNIMEVDQVLDGEIYSHELTFQEMIRLVKKLRPESAQLDYYVFDLVDTKIDNTARKDILEKMTLSNTQIKLVRTKIVTTKDMMNLLHNKYIEKGFEGLIIRNFAGMYKLNGRSADLQKYKEFQDEEFIITGGKESTGSEAGCIIFDVKNSKGQEFAVRPRGSFELRKEWMKDIKNLVSKKLTVRFQELTDDGIPRFPVGISIRDYEI